MLSNAYDLLICNFHLKDNKVAVKERGVSYTYNQLISDIDNISEHLSNYIKSGMRVGIYLPNSYIYIVLMFACVRLGCIVVPINWINEKMNVANIINDSDMNILIAHEKSQLPNMDFISVKPENYENIIIYNIKNDEGKELYKCTYDNDTLIQNDVFLLLYTSGSTGKSKGIIITHYNLIVGTEIVAKYLSITDKDILLSVLPFSFDYGLNQVMTAFYSAATVVILYPYIIHEIPKTLINEHITGFAAMPTIWINLISKTKVSDHQYPDLRYITNTGEAIPEKYLNILPNIFSKTNIYLMYGLTECFRCTYLDPQYFQSKRGSIGKAIPGCEVYVLNEDNISCKPNEIGELVFRGPTVSKGYVGGESHSEHKVFRQNLFNSFYQENVVFSGDLVFFDNDGFLFFVGRKDNMIKKHGYRTNAGDIANLILNNVNFLEECCIISERNVETSESTIIAVIRIKSNLDIRRCTEDLLDYSKKHLPLYMKLDDVLAMDSIPKLNSEKYDINKLKIIYKNNLNGERAL